ncbi:MAG: tetratricopeptide repeat protein [Planctomycetes bacterium]|nr:tetratricopeptide repeat protein [Planctomycetota bacterium]
MNRPTTRRAPVLAGILWLALAAASSRTAFATRNVKEGDPMPAFSLPRAGGAGGECSSTELQGQPGVVVFWQPHQKLSLDALRDLEAIVQELGAKRVRVAAIDASRSTAEAVGAALAGEKLSLTVALDPQRELYGKVGVIVCPTTLVVDALGTLRFILASHPRTYSQVVRARLRFLLGDLDEQGMQKEIEPAVLKVDHDLAAAWRMYNLGRKLQGEGKSEQAIAMYEKAVSQQPSLPEARCALGFMKLAAGDLDGAAQHFQAAVTYQPASPTARLGQAAVLARLGSDQKAEELLLSLLGQASIATRVRYELGRIYRARGELGKAVTYFEDALGMVFLEPGLEAGTAPPAPAAPPLVAAAGAPQAPAEAGTSPAATAAVAAAAPTPPAAVVQPVLPPAGAQFLGVKGCKKCHLQQWKSWQETKMSHAVDLLKPGARSEVKAARKLDPQKDYTADSRCLACHSTGFGYAGGYEVPPAGDAARARAVEETACVSCESCHGPGGKYVAVHKHIQDNRRRYTQDELYAAGQSKIEPGVCAACHNQSAPCIPQGYAFDFEKRKEQGTHKHYELNYRAR